MKTLMKKKLIKRGMIFVILIFLGGLVSAQTLKVRLMETTDIHVNLMNYDYYQDKESNTSGLVKTATLIGNARTEVKNSMLLDNGDLIQGNPLGDYVARGRVLRFGEIHPVYKAMNLLGYDVGNIGNHEFNYGLGFLGKTLHGANFPYVNSNVYYDDGDKNPDNDQHYFQPYLILNKTFTDESGNDQHLRVGVIGFVPPQVMVWDSRNLTGKVTAKDIVKTAKKYVPEMREKGADLVIAIPHSGLNSKPAKGLDENATYYLSQVAGIDAILFGHSHTVFPGRNFEKIEGVDNKKGKIFGTAAVMPGFWGSHLGIIDLTLEKQSGKWRIVDSQSEARSIFKREGRKSIPLVDANPLIVAAVKKDHEATLAYVRRKVGESVANINSFFALVQDDPSVQIVSLAQQWYVKKIVQGTELEEYPILSAAAPFKAGGRGGPEYFTNISAGTIALKNVSDLYIYPNDLKVVLLTGAQVKDWLERSVMIFNQINPNESGEQVLVGSSPSYNFDVIDGVTYEIDVTQPAKYDAKGNLVDANANRIKNLRFEGKSIDMNKKFLVATNNYRAGGGGGFPALDGSTIVIDAPDKNRDVLANYLIVQGKINPTADSNWKFANINNVNVVFETSPSARSMVDANNRMQFVRINEKGFAVVKLKMSN